MSQRADRAPAPDPLGLVQDFVNTRDLAGDQDELADPARLRDWLVGRSLLKRGSRVSAGEHRSAIAVREALRDLMRENNGGPAAAGAAELLSETLARSRPELRFTTAGVGRAEVRVAAGGVDGALGRLLASVYEAMRDGSWSRMKACTDERCQWAFYDRSRNASGRWCSMAVCGTRAKVEAAAARSGRARRSA